MERLPVPIVIAVLSFAAAPGTLSFAVVRHGGWQSESTKRLVHSAVAVALAMLCLACFGTPKLHWTVVGVVAGLAGGVVYYRVEQVRIRRSESVLLGAARFIGVREALGAAALAVMGAAEELIFRWYLLVVPVAYGLLTPLTAGVISVVLFAVLHYEFGIVTMLSRGLLGIALTLVVVFLHALVPVVLVHAVYNALVQARPVHYLSRRKASLP